MSRFARLCAVALAMTVVLAGMVGLHAANRAGGQEILLEMEPVDPRDLLLGHYVIIDTSLHRLDTAALAGPDTGWRRGRPVFVALEAGGDGAMHATGAFRAPPEPPFIRGRIAHVSTQFDHAPAEPLEDGSPGLRRDPVEGSQRDVLRVRYNLERYYASPDQALALERMRNDGRLRLIVSLGADGNAVIKGLEIDGEARRDTLF
ncbi:hypothetical protein AY599_09345 [Leptolyngbya valderiana BDU 20041]|nr:hypothetical protein AY599_09345 [Leptolyngbya valderiana BDU 20041]